MVKVTIRFLALGKMDDLSLSLSLDLNLFVFLCESKLSLSRATEVFVPLNSRTTNVPRFEFHERTNPPRYESPIKIWS